MMLYRGQKGVTVPYHVLLLGFGYTERAEEYAPDDASKVATLDIKGRGRGRGGSVPFADTEDDRNLASVDPAYYGRDDEVCTFIWSYSSIYKQLSVVH